MFYDQTPGPRHLTALMRGGGCGMLTLPTAVEAQIGVAPGIDRTVGRFVFALFPV